jgi:hypothetical protein
MTILRQADALRSARKTIGTPMIVGGSAYTATAAGVTVVSGSAARLEARNPFHAQ